MMKRSLQHCTLRPLFWKSSLCPINATNHTAAATRAHSSHPQNQKQTQILAAALPHVHAHGWTERALAEGVLTSQLPPSYIGFLADNESDLVHYFMRECNQRLSKALEEKNIESEGLTHAQVIEWAIRTRLEMNIPFVRSQRWHEGMALGAMPLNALETARSLEQMVDIIVEKGISRCSHDNHSHRDDSTQAQSKEQTGTKSSTRLFLEKGAIGAVYVATELHLLSDHSMDYQDTWSFLKQRVMDLEQAATKHNTSTSSIPLPSSDVLVAGAAVASSLGGAVLSLLAPAARFGVESAAASVVPQIMKFMQEPSSRHRHSLDSTVGTKAQDYDLSDLPPFEVHGEQEQHDDSQSTREIATVGQGQGWVEVKKEKCES